MTDELAGRVAVVTGGAAGIGLATVEAFLAEGAEVVLADVDVDKGRRVAAAHGSRAHFVDADVADPEQVRALVGSAVERFGGLHVMVNNAGASGAAHPRFLDDDLADFERVNRVNVLGVLAGCRYAAEHMAAHGGGSIVNISSIAGVVAGFGLLSYRASKAAVIHVTRSLAIDLAEYGIRVNCLAPGNIDTRMMDSFTTAGMSEQDADDATRAVRALRMAAQPLQRQGVPEDVADAAVYLAGDRSKQVTGTLLPVDGGIVAGDPVNTIAAIIAAAQGTAGRHGTDP